MPIARGDDAGAVCDVVHVPGARHDALEVPRQGHGVMQGRVGRMRRVHALACDCRVPAEGRIQ